MSGHSKWSTIKHRKEANDVKKGKTATKILREISVAAKNGGGDQSSNAKLRLAVSKAKDNNLTRDNIERAIKRGIGELDGVNYTELRFEGYGILGVGVIVDCLTDNNQRTVAEVRHVFSKHGGSLGTDGSVAYQFQDCGQFIFDNDNNEAVITEFAINYGAIDIVVEPDCIELIVNSSDYFFIKQTLEESGMIPIVHEITMRPMNNILLTGDNVIKMQKLLDAMEALDDVQSVYSNSIID